MLHIIIQKRGHRPYYYAPCVKFRKYFQMRQLLENTFQSFNMEVYENFFFSWNYSFVKCPGKTIDFTTYLAIYYHFY